MNRYTRSIAAAAITLGLAGTLTATADARPQSNDCERDQMAVTCVRVYYHDAWRGQNPDGSRAVLAGPGVNRPKILAEAPSRAAFKFLRLEPGERVLLNGRIDGEFVTFGTNIDDDAIGVRTVREDGFVDTIYLLPVS